MTTAQVVETSVAVNNNSPIKDYVHLDDQTQPTFEITCMFKTMLRCSKNRQFLQKEKKSFLYKRCLVC